MKRRSDAIYLTEMGAFIARRITITCVGTQRVAALAISNQRETAIGWSRASGRPLGTAITWQCSRTADFCRALREQGHEA